MSFSLDSISRSISQSDVLITVDRVCDYLPFVSTITNLAVILKKIELDYNGTQLTEDQHYYLHIQKKDYVDCFVLLIPVIGNIAYANIFSCCFPSFTESQDIMKMQKNFAEMRINSAQRQLTATLSSLATSATSGSGQVAQPEDLKFAEGKNKELSEAIKLRDVEKVRLLLEDNVDPNFEELGKSHFIHACREGELEICKLMLPKITDINSLDKFGDTCLIQACKSGNEDLVEFLLENGADPSIKKHNGVNALFAAVQGKNIKIFDHLVKLSGENAEKIILVERDNNQNTILRL